MDSTLYVVYVRDLDIETPEIFLVARPQVGEMISWSAKDVSYTAVVRHIVITSREIELYVEEIDYSRHPTDVWCPATRDGTEEVVEAKG